MISNITSSSTYQVKRNVNNFFLDESNYQETSSTVIKTKRQYKSINGLRIPYFINEFWTSKQRQASSLHEISYRACFKPQLPRFFIENLSEKEDIVYDPFSGRGTTIIEGGLLARNLIANDINPLSHILSTPRIEVPELNEIKKRLCEIKMDKTAKASIDLSMFYHSETESEIVSLQKYLSAREKAKSEDYVDRWIRMVATNRLTGHSSGFFSVYTLPPNQAVSAEKQKIINEKRNQKPVYRDTKELIYKKSNSLLRNFTNDDKENLNSIKSKALFLTQDASSTKEILSNSVQLTVTSPPFLNIVDYSNDNWLRCWFNNINSEIISNQITMKRKLDDWSEVMQTVFDEIYRITKIKGWLAFEVGEVHRGKTSLEDFVIPLGIKSGFDVVCVLINSQEFTKTSNIWGVSNNKLGTNTNRIVLFYKN